VTACISSWGIGTQPEAKGGAILPAVAAINEGGLVLTLTVVCSPR
jgi:hypothetical protein